MYKWPHLSLCKAASSSATGIQDGTGCCKQRHEEEAKGASQQNDCCVSDTSSILVKQVCHNFPDSPIALSPEDEEETHHQQYVHKNYRTDII
jgi:hypothetical protein